MFLCISILFIKLCSVYLWYVRYSFFLLGIFFVCFFVSRLIVFVYFFVCVFIYLYVSLSGCVFLWLFVLLFVCLYVCLFFCVWEIRRCSLMGRGLRLLTALQPNCLFNKYVTKNNIAKIWSNINLLLRHHKYVKKNIIAKIWSNISL